MKILKIMAMLLVFNVAHSQQKSVEDIELSAWQDLLDENRITQFEFNQKTAQLNYQKQQNQINQLNSNQTPVMNGPGGTASISGTIIAANAENIWVNVCTGNVYNCPTGATTDVNGDYMVTGLDAGTYFVVARDDNDDYINAIWSSTGTEPCFNNCATDADNQIVLADAEARAGVDMSLTVGASVSGNVVSGSTGIENSYVSIRNTASSPSFFGGAGTGISGDYTIRGLPDGDFYLQIQDASDIYIDAMWSSVGTVQCYSCTPDADSTLTLVPAEIRNGVDFDLVIGASISGQITDQVSLAGVETLGVQLYNTVDSDDYWYFLESFDGTGTGTYTVSGIPAGTYKAYLEPKFNVENVHIPEIYNNIQCNACSTLLFNGSGDELNLVNGVNTSGIDFALQVGASISGFIVDNNNIFETVTEFGRIFLFNDSNRVLTTQTIYGTLYEPTADGSYKVGGLLPGMYFVQGGDAGRQFYQRELFENIACPWSGCDRGGGGDSVVLGDGENRLGVNFLLNQGGKITGTVTDAITGLPIESEFTQFIQFYDSSGEVAGGAGINPDGTYIAARALPPGTYSVRTGTMFSGQFISPYVMEKYAPAGNIDCPGVTCDLTSGNVTVTAYDPLNPTPEDSATTTGIDFALSEAFSFSGTITDLSPPNDPIADVHVLVYNDNGDFANWATTDDAGEFTVHGLPAGTYYALTNNGSNLPFMGLNQTESGGWIDILFNGMPCPGSACDVTDGDPIVLAPDRDSTSSVSGGFNFSMAEGGTITGQVRSFGSQLPASGVEVNVYNSNGDFYGSYVTDSDGYYLTVGFPAGTYYLTTSNNGALIDEKFGGGYCIDESCDPLDATPLVIVGNQAVTGANFNLRPDYIFKSGLD